MLYLLLTVLLIAFGYYWFVIRAPSNLNSSPNAPARFAAAAAAAAKTAPAAVAAAPVLPPGKRVAILFGSQTGTAEEFARKIKTAGAAAGLPCVVIDMEDYEVEDLCSERVVVFVVATYGEGEPTSNAERFYTWLLDTTAPLTGVSFTVFGLGNKTYEHYNAIGKAIDRRLRELGATALFPLGLGDDDSALEEDFERWRRAGLLPALAPPLGVTLTAAAAPESLRQFRLLRPAASAALLAAAHSFADRRAGTVDHRAPLLARVVRNAELHGAGSDRSCRHVELALAGRARYAPGDHLGVFPQNADALVERLAARMRWGAAELDALVALVPADEPDDARALAKAHLPPCTLRLVLRECFNLTDPPRKAALAALAEYAQDAGEADVLRELGATADEDAPGARAGVPRERDYGEWVKADHRSVVEVLEHFGSVDVPLDVLLEHLAVLAPRYYSISSSLRAHADTVHITCVLVDFVKPTGEAHAGVCSHYLARLPPTLPVYVRASKFRLPPTLATPIVMVGPGTGLAPFRGFLQERRALLAEKRRKDEGRKEAARVGEAVLYFGCRRRDVDYLYREEMEGYAADGTLSSLHVAFSREQEKKVYVQDLMREKENGAKVWDALGKREGWFYICGDARAMAPAVREAMRDVFAEHGGMTADAANAYIERMQEKGRFHSDTWF